MPYDAKRLIEDVTFGYGLSGSRRNAAFRNWKRGVLLNIVLIPIAILCVVIALVVGKREVSPYIYFGIAITITIAFSIYGYVKRDTSWQLWFRERHEIRQNRKQNLDELMEHAHTVKHGNSSEK